jgi:hypothetical protein
MAEIANDVYTSSIVANMAEIVYTSYTVPIAAVQSFKPTNGLYV